MFVLMVVIAVEFEKMRMYAGVQESHHPRRAIDYGSHGWTGGTDAHGGSEATLCSRLTNGEDEASSPDTGHSRARCVKAATSCQGTGSPRQRTADHFKSIQMAPE